jgi:hypothetical protein
MFAWLKRKIKESFANKYSFTVYSERVNLYGEKVTRVTKFFEADFEAVRRRFVKIYGKEPKVIKCDYPQVHETRGSYGANFTIASVSAPTMDFLGVGVEVKDAYMDKLTKLGTKALSVKPKAIIWADADTIVKLKLEYQKLNKRG